MNIKTIRVFKETEAEKSKRLTDRQNKLDSEHRKVVNAAIPIIEYHLSSEDLPD